MLNAIIMASGFSNRMGSNKLMLKYKDKTLIEHILDKVIVCGFQDIVLVARNKEILKMGNIRGIKGVYNENAEAGQSESIKLGLINSREADGYAFFTGDQPLIDVETIKYIMNRFYEKADSIIVPVFKEQRGTPVIFHKRFKAELLDLKGDTGGRQIIGKHMDSVTFAEVREEFLLFDVDTEEDYEKLLFPEDK